MNKIDVAGTLLEITRIPASRRDLPALLLLHEGLGCVALWKEFPRLLAEGTGCEVVAYSRRGYGRSDPLALPWPVTYMHEEAELLPEILDALDLGRVIGVGHSDGASIAIIAAGSDRFPGLEGLVLESPHVFTEEHGLTEIRKAGIAYRDTDLRDRLARYQDNVDVAFVGWHDAWTHPDFVTWNLEDYLRSIDVPALLIQEADDPYGTLDQLDAIEEGIAGPVERIVLAGHGHSPHRSHPDEVVAAIALFLDRQRLLGVDYGL